MKKTNFLGDCCSFCSVPISQTKTIQELRPRPISSVVKTNDQRNGGESIEQFEGKNFIDNALSSIA